VRENLGEGGRGERCKARHTLQPNLMSLEREATVPLLFTSDVKAMLSFNDEQ